MVTEIFTVNCGSRIGRNQLGPQVEAVTSQSCAEGFCVTSARCLQSPHANIIYIWLRVKFNQSLNSTIWNISDKKHPHILTPYVHLFLIKQERVEYFAHKSVYIKFTSIFTHFLLIPRTLIPPCDG